MKLTGGSRSGATPARLVMSATNSLIKGKMIEAQLISATFDISLFFLNPLGKKKSAAIPTEIEAGAFSPWTDNVTKSLSKF